MTTPRTIPAEQQRRARDLRTNATPAERKLWAQLRNRQLGGHKFTRQIAIGPYIADLVCRQSRLVIELDGGLHTPEGDAPRQRFIEAQGYRVLRFCNGDVLQAMDGVLAAIVAALGEGTSLPQPLPQAGGESLSSPGEGDPQPMERPNSPPACGRGWGRE